MLLRPLTKLFGHQVWASTTGPRAARKYPFTVRSEMRFAPVYGLDAVVSDTPAGAPLR